MYTYQSLCFGELMYNARQILCYGICGSIGLALIGCTKVGPVDKETASGGLSPSPYELKERLEEERLEAAMKGLSYSSGMVKVIVNRPGDRAKAVKATAFAENNLNVENTWFKAAGHFRDAILADPTYAPAYEGLARALLLESKTDLAASALKTALSLDPNYSKARFELGTITQMSGDYRGALNVWKEVVAKDPGYPDAYARMAIASYFEQDFKSAYTYLAEADKRKQNVPPQFRGLLKEAAARP